MPDSAPVLRASLPDLAAPLLAPLTLPAARSRGPGHVEHEKKPFFSLLENSRSEDGGQGRAALQRVHRSEAETLDGHRSGGYRASARREAHSPPILCFQHVYATALQSALRVNERRRAFTFANTTEPRC